MDRATWRKRAQQTPDAYLGAYCCPNGVGRESADHPDWATAPGAMLDRRRAHGLGWDDLPADLSFGGVLWRESRGDG
jgi:hypothetical protein